VAVEGNELAIIGCRKMDAWKGELCYCQSGLVAYARLLDPGRDVDFPNKCADAVVAGFSRIPLPLLISIKIMSAEQMDKDVYPKGPRTKALAAGTKAPGFTLKSTPDQSLSLSDFQGKSVILAFYPADWSPVCGDQMALYNEVLPEFRKFDAELLGISVDGVWCHAAFARNLHLHFPLLSDFEPKGAVARQYGAFRESDGVSERALFVINPEGIIHWSYVSPVGINPGANGILDALEELQNRKVPV
jgi:peroxiredoxin